MKKDAENKKRLQKIKNSAKKFRERAVEKESLQEAFYSRLPASSTASFAISVALVPSRRTIGSFPTPPSS